MIKKRGQEAVWPKEERGKTNQKKNSPSPKTKNKISTKIEKIHKIKKWKILSPPLPDPKKKNLPHQKKINNKIKKMKTNARRKKIKQFFFKKNQKNVLLFLIFLFFFFTKNISFIF